MDIGAVQKSVWSFVLNEPTRVLVADDDPILLEFATVHLSSPAAVIETASDGARAWSMLTGGHFDIALVDIAMPAPDGFALLEMIRAEPKLRHLPVMMLTGYEDIASIDRAYSLGANSFVTKPVNWRLLSYHIRYVLRASRVENELRRERRRTEMRQAPHDSRQVEQVRDGLRPEPKTAAAVQRIEAVAADALGQRDEETIPFRSAVASHGRGERGR